MNLTEKDKRIELVGIEEADAELIEKIYFFSRSDEFAVLGWSDEQLKQFLKMQSDFQQRSYSMLFPRAESLLIVFNGHKVGRLIVERGAQEIRLVDISILPEFRNSGIGSAIVSDLINESNTTSIPLTLQVEKNNTAAFRLYQRSGFVVNGENDIYFSMIRLPQKKES